MTRYKVFFYYKGKRHFYINEFKNAKEAKSWQNAINRNYYKKSGKGGIKSVYVDTTKEYTRKKRKSTRQRRNPYSMNLFGGDFRL